MHHRTPAAPLALAAALLALAALVGCRTDTTVEQAVGARPGMEPRLGPGRLTASEIQSEVMSFVDTYSAIYGMPIDALVLRAETPRRRLFAQMLANEGFSNALVIASGPNPVVSMLDMIVMVSLQRRAWDSGALREFWGDDAEPVAAALAQLEERVWQIGNRALSPEPRAALVALIDQMAADSRDQFWVTRLRASDFAEERQRSFVTVRGGGSLLSLFALDPLANLNPTTRELAQSRLLAERVFFFSSRAPQLLGNQFQQALLETSALPETQRTIESLEQGNASISRAVDAIDEFNRTLQSRVDEMVDHAAMRLGEQREAAAADLGAIVAREREAAIDQAFDRLAAEREAIFGQLEGREEELRTLLAEFRATVEATRELSVSVQATVESIERLATPSTPSEDREPGQGAGFTWPEYRAAAQDSQRAVAEANRLMESLEKLLASPAWSERGGEMAQALAELRAGGDSLIDRAFQRALVLVLVLVAGGFAASLGARILAARLAPRR